MHMLTCMHCSYCRISDEWHFTNKPGGTSCASGRELGTSCMCGLHCLRVATAAFRKSGQWCPCWDFSLEKKSLVKNNALGGSSAAEGDSCQGVTRRQSGNSSAGRSPSAGSHGDKGDSLSPQVRGDKRVARCARKCASFLKNARVSLSFSAR